MKGHRSGPFQGGSSVRVVLFCGDESPYGRAHLLPVLRGTFSVQAVVVPTPACWQRFRARLMGTGVPPPQRVRGRAILQSLLRRARAALVGGGPGQPNLWNTLDATFPKSQVREVCAERGVPFREITDVNTPEVLGWMAKQGPDLLLCAAYPQIFGSALLATVRLGAVNFHPSLLPRCRGANPIYWAIASGEKETGVSAHFMTQEVDAGDLVEQIPIPIAEEDDYWSLYRKALREIPHLVEAVEAFFAESRTRGIPQDPREATSFREPRQLHRRLMWGSRSAAALVRQVRAGEAFFITQGRWIGVRRAALVPTDPILTNDLQVPAGTVIAIRDGELVVAVEGGGVAIREAVYRGRTMIGSTLAACLPLQIGEILS